MSFTAINCVAIQAQISIVFRNCSCQRCCHAVCSETGMGYYLQRYFLSSFLNLLCCGSEIRFFFFHVCPLPPKQELWTMPITCFPLCSSQIMSPIPPVSSPPLTSKTKELADNENLDVSQILYLAFLIPEAF